MSQESKSEQAIRRMSNVPVVRIIDDEMRTITTIGAWSSCEHPLKNLAIEFIEKVKTHYRNNPE